LKGFVSFDVRSKVAIESFGFVGHFQLKGKGDDDKEDIDEQQVNYKMKF